MNDTRNATRSIGQDRAEERGTNMKTTNRTNDAGRSPGLRTKFISIVATGALALALLAGAAVVHGPAVFAEEEGLIPQTPDQDTAICDNAGGDPEMDFDDSGAVLEVECSFPDGSGWACGDVGFGYTCATWGDDEAHDLGDAPGLPIPPLDLAPIDPPEPPDLGLGDAPEDGDVFVDPPEPGDEPDEDGDEPGQDGDAPGQDGDAATDEATETAEEQPAAQSSASVTIDESDASQVANDSDSANSNQASSVSLLVVAVAVALVLALIGALTVIRQKMRA